MQTCPSAQLQDEPKQGLPPHVSLASPLRVHEMRRHGEAFGWAVDGSPADCVKLAILELLDEPVDLVLSGIKVNSNGLKT